MDRIPGIRFKLGPNTIQIGAQIGALTSDWGPHLRLGPTPSATSAHAIPSPFPPCSPVCSSAGQWWRCWTLGPPCVVSMHSSRR